MQLMIDTATATRAEMLAAVAMLTTLAPHAQLSRLADRVDGNAQVMLCAADEQALAPLPPPPAAPHAAPVAAVIPAASAIPSALTAPAVAGDAPLPLPPVPTAAAAAPAPAPSAAAPAPVASSDLDADGLPWDERIHASTKVKTKDDKWRMRRGLAVGVLQAVTAELRARNAGALPAIPATGSDTGAVTSPVAVPPPPPAAMVPPPPVTLPGNIPPPPPPPVAAAVLPGALTFESLMERITAAMNGQKLSYPQLTEALVGSGVPTLAALMSAPDDRLAAVEAYLRRWSV